MKTLIPGIAAMALIVAASNILVQHPMGAYLTYGALTYPLSFLVNDITNRLHGARAARIVVIAGFVTGLVCSLIAWFPGLTTLRIAFGSGTAFLIGQLLDVTIFNRLRRGVWWRAPLVSTLIGSTLDSVIFFTIAFAGALAFLEPSNIPTWAAEPGALLGTGPVVPFWISLAVADWCVKFAIAWVGLLPFRLFVARKAAKTA